MKIRKISIVLCKDELKQSHYRPGQALKFQDIDASIFQENRHMKVIRLSIICSGRLYLQEIFLVHFSV